MALRVLIAPDKFKGTLTAQAAAAALARGWRSVRAEDGLTLLPISDGGDGFGLVMGKLLKARPRMVATVDAAGRPVRSGWWWDARTKTAVVESAQTMGLAMLPRGAFHPFDLDTTGLAAVMQSVAKSGAKRCIIGIGGSATNDGGFGLARALGWNFFGKGGEPITRWTELSALNEIKRPARKLKLPQLLVAVDVQNPLLGPKGCTRIYGPQKGLQPTDFAEAERALRRLARCVGWVDGKRPGMGAAGGLGFGLAAFCGGRLVPGFELFAKEAKLAQEVKRADLVLFGEGAIDHSTFMGKGVGELVGVCRHASVPCIGFGGMVKRAEVGKKLWKVYGLNEMTNAEESMARAAHWLEQLAANAARELKL